MRKTRLPAESHANREFFFFFFFFCVLQYRYRFNGLFKLTREIPCWFRCHIYIVMLNLPKVINYATFSRFLLRFSGKVLRIELKRAECIDPQLSACYQF